MVLLLTAGAVCLAGAGVAAMLQARRERPLVTVGLRFGSDLAGDAVEAFLASVTGLSPRTTLVLDTFASEVGIRHALTSDQATVDIVCGQLRGLIPSTRIEPGFAHPATTWTNGAQLSWSARHTVLRADAAEAATAGLLAALFPLGSEEALLVRVSLRPGRPSPLPQPRTQDQARPGALALFDLLVGRSPVSTEQLSAVRAKQNGPLLQARVAVAVACGNPGRAAHLLGRVSAVFRARRGSSGHLLVRRLGPDALARLGHGWRRAAVFSPAELVGLVGWPIGAPSLPGLALGTAPLLLPDRRIPTQGRPLGLATWPGMEHRVLAQPILGALSHTMICGPTGVGKSALITNLALADLREGRGCLVIDGKGDLADDLLARIPQERLADLIVLDPAADGPMPGLRVFGQGRDPELTADLVLGVLRDLFADSWGVRSEQWLRAGLVTLAHDPTGTLGDLPYLFSDDAYRRRLVGRLRDPLLLATWAAFEAMKPGERANQLGAPLNKLNQLLGRRVLRTVLSQPKPSLDLTDVIRRGRVVIVSLSPGRMGAPAARLMGALIVHQLLVAVQARAAIAPARRRPFSVYIDEPRVLGDIPVPLDTLFELARGLGVGMTLAVQSVTQLPTAIRNAALTNSGSLIAFRQNHDDAELLAAQLSGLSAEGLEHLGPFEMIARVGLGPGDVAAPVSGRTLPPPSESSDRNSVRRASSERYGTDPALVDQTLADRHGHPDRADAQQDESEIGRQRRKP